MNHTSKRVKKSEKPVATSKLPSMNVLWHILGVVIIIASTYFFYRGALNNAFVNWDDQVYVEEQPMVLEKEYAALWKTPISLNYHPLTMTSLAAQVPKDVKKLSPKPFIHVNIWLHIFNSILIFILIWNIHRKNWWVAIFTALIFALHPTHVESVVWVSERKDVLYSFFFLLACISYWQYLQKKNIGWFLFAFVLFVCSLLSKAVAVTLPLVLLLLDYWQNRSFKDRQLWIEKVPFFVLSLFFGLMAISVQRGGDFGGLLTLAGEKTKALAEIEVFTIWERIQFASYGFVNYILKFFAPIHLSAFYPYPEGNSLGAFGIAYPLLVVVLGGLAVWSMKRTKIFAFSLGFYFVTIALVLQFLSVGLAITADRYTYIPYIGLGFCVMYILDTWLVPLASYMKYAVSITLGIVLIFLGLQTQKQAMVWKDSETLWSQVLEIYPTCDLALGNRGNYRGKNGNIQGAMQDFEVAISDGCDEGNVYEGLGNCYGSLAMQQPSNKDELVQKSIMMYQKAIEIDSTKVNVYINLGITQVQTNSKDAIITLEKALAKAPFKEAYILPAYGAALINVGQNEKAIQVLSQTIQKHGSRVDVLYNRALAYTNIGNIIAAKADLNAVLAINPNHEGAKAKLSEL